jgi:hypothetical protein
MLVPRVKLSIEVYEGIFEFGMQNKEDGSIIIGNIEYPEEVN